MLPTPPPPPLPSSNVEHEHVFIPLCFQHCTPGGGKPEHAFQNRVLSQTYWPGLRNKTAFHRDCIELGTQS